VRVQFCSVTVERAAYEGNIVFNINVSKYNTRFNAGDVPEVTTYPHYFEFVEGE